MKPVPTGQMARGHHFGVKTHGSQSCLEENPTQGHVKWQTMRQTQMSFKN
jgi:hypothetical protein